MRIIMLSVNHHTAPVEMRERLALTGARLDQALDQLRKQYPTAEVVVLCTCNRTELYLARPTHEPPSIDDLRTFLADFCHVGLQTLVPASIHREQEQAVTHLFRVATGLESMVLGEPQILGQIKRAYEHAHTRGAVGPVLHHVFQQALRAAKLVRSQTGIDDGRTSIGSVAVDFARRIFERFDDKTVVGIGTGEMAKLTLRHLKALRPARLWVTSRTIANAQQLAAALGLGGGDSPSGARHFDDLDELLVHADIVLTGTGASEPIITAEHFRPLIKRRRSRPLFIIDIAVPRDVEPAVGTLSNVYLYNIDDLQQVVAQTHDQRSEQVQRCDAMLQEAVHRCMAEIQHRQLGQLIRQLRRRLHELGQAEQQRTARKIASARPEDLTDILDEHTRRVVNKILHLPLSQLDRKHPDTVLSFYAAALSRLFQLDERPQTDESPELEDVTEQPVPTIITSGQEGQDAQVSRR